MSLGQLKKNLGVTGMVRALIFVGLVLAAGIAAALAERYDVAAGAFVGLALPRLVTDRLAAQPKTTGRVLALSAVSIASIAVALAAVRGIFAWVDPLVTGPAAGLWMLLVAGYMGSFVAFLSDSRVDFRKR